MPVYSFKSSGTQLKKSTDTPAVVPEALPIGIKTPLELDESGRGILVMNYDLIGQVSDNLRNLIQTNFGERLGLYNYGANLGPLMSELASQEDFDSQAISRISTAVGLWMPYINLGTFESTINHDENTGRGPATLEIKITYDIPSISVTGKQLLITMYAI